MSLFISDEKTMDEQLAYWRQRLANLPLLALPTDRPRQSIASYQKASVAFVVPEQLHAALVALSQQENVTLSTTLLTSFRLLLSRYSGQEEIAIAVTDPQNTTTFVLRTHLSNDLTIRELLAQVSGTMLDAWAHAGGSFHQVQEALSCKPGDLPSLVQVAFQADDARNDLPPTSETEPEEESPGFDLNLSLATTAEGLVGTLKYNAALFDTATIQRLAGHYKILLEGIAAAPQQRSWQLPILTETEREQLLIDWNNTATDYPRDRCIHQLFEAQALCTPGATALVFQDQQLTYHELNVRANQMAHYLRRLGVGPDVLVGLCVERSLEMIVALLGILKAGGAYVPLDISYPEGLLTFMLEDTQVHVLVTQSWLAEKLPGHRARLVCLDRDWQAIAHESADNPPGDVQSEHLAYVMYTSGSTGKPKGVAITHRNVVRLVKMTNYVALTAEQIFLQLAPISFDASTFEIWGCLLNGARLIIPPPHAISLEELATILGQYRITILWLTAGLFHQMVESRLEGLARVRQLLAGGDVLPVGDVRRVLQTLKTCQLINGYGPTESTTFACCYAVTDAEQIGTSVPIGRPIANTQVYVLDPHLQPVPIGVTGELYIGGDGLGRGYLNRPELTAQRFIFDPFSQQPGARLYKTGDQVRYRPDGAIEFLGRNDDQVKIRGFRIELSGIETVLGEHPAVRECVVGARPDTGGQKRLIAYLVPAGERRALIEDVRAYAEQRLPGYMLPAAFVLVDDLPLTANGKVDRKALPEPVEYLLDPIKAY
ncbi:MAG TPA: amino acid adenylation domain-containing protein, partial [Ktedonobacteraceae bacterium]